MRHLLVLADSLAWHGPDAPCPLPDPRLWPNIAAAALAEQTGDPWAADVVGRLGWTARDAWWAMTKDPVVWSVLLPRADAVVLGVGSMDTLPATLPTYLREGIAYLRPGWLRRAVRATYSSVHPRVVPLTGRWLRQLPQAATDHYLSRCVGGVRHYRPGVPVIGLVPPPHDSRVYGGVRGSNVAAQSAALAWGREADVPMVRADLVVAPQLAVGRHNTDGLHWGWESHRGVGQALAAAVTKALAASATVQR